MGTSPWEPLLGNLYLGTSIREPGGMGFGAAPLCSETFTMAEDPSSLRCWGKTFLQLDFDFKKKTDTKLQHGLRQTTGWVHDIKTCLDKRRLMIKNRRVNHVLAA